MTQWTQTANIGEFQTRTFERQLHWPSGEVLWQSVRTGLTLTRPFAAVSPDSLSVHGFVRTVSADSVLYYGPDADVLLSEQFLDTHCFRARRGEKETAGLIGLAFDPARGRKLPDIKGTLWIDPKSNELEFIEFAYTGVNSKMNVKGVGGRTYFRRLPNGAWIVDGWFITLPVPRPSIDGFVAAGLMEGGGEIVEVKLGDVVMPKANLTGIVFDSINHVPLERAFVYISGTAHSATTDSIGRFTIAGVPQGKFTLAFSHPSFDSLPVLPAPKEIAVDPPTNVTADLAVPSTATVVARVCPTAKSEAFIIGRVENARGTALPETTITVSYRHAGRWHKQKVVTDAEGKYVICGLPTHVRIDLWAGQLREPRVGAPGGVPQSVAINARRYARVNLEVH